MSTPRPSLGDLGQLVYDARRARGWGRRVASQQPGAPKSPITWEKVETGKDVDELSFTKIELALGWAAGSMQAYLDGGPEPAPAPQPTEPRDADELPPRLNQATFDELTAEMRRRHEALRAELGRRLAPVLAEQETAESVRARGMIPGRRIRDDDAGSSADDAAGGRQA